MSAINTYLVTSVRSPDMLQMSQSYACAVYQCLPPLSHNTETTHWLDPRLSRVQKHSPGECGDDGESCGHSKPLHTLACCSLVMSSCELCDVLARRG